MRSQRRGGSGVGPASTVFFVAVASWSQARWHCVADVAVAGTSTLSDELDRNVYCADWVKFGECTRNIRFMTQECPLSCAADAKKLGRRVVAREDDRWPMAQLNGTAFAQEAVAASTAKTSAKVSATETNVAVTGADTGVAPATWNEPTPTARRFQHEKVAEQAAARRVVEVPLEIRVAFGEQLDKIFAQIEGDHDEELRVMRLERDEEAEQHEQALAQLRKQLDENAKRFAEEQQRLTKYLRTCEQTLARRETRLITTERRIEVMIGTIEKTEQGLANANQQASIVAAQSMAQGQQLTSLAERRQEVLRQDLESAESYYQALLAKQPRRAYGHVVDCKANIPAADAANVSEATNDQARFSDSEGDDGGASEDANAWWRSLSPADDAAVLRLRMAICLWLLGCACSADVPPPMSSGVAAAASCLGGSKMRVISWVLAFVGVACWRVMWALAARRLVMASLSVVMRFLGWVHRAVGFRPPWEWESAACIHDGGASVAATATEVSATQQASPWAVYSLAKPLSPLQPPPPRRPHPKIFMF
eukprot:TRINITY_DN50351_c0_g1_i1.p1 TRINITY_DN50351_c0_g1~~TRINITY_DN50351_c0_g1_i1.p1  ORF type:complete len:538 (+),score=126.97 TRINITY_DN50351_c0_g1_i1:97-1710(+)